MTADFAQRTMALPSGPVEYRVAGSGRDVVYLHSAAGARISEPLRRLARRFRVWAPTMPGFDGTAYHDGVDSMSVLAELAARFVEAGPGGACDVIGSSLGGWIGAWLALRHPDLVGHLVLSAPAGFRPAGAPRLSFEPEVMRAQLYAHPERVPPDGKTPEMRRASLRAVGHYDAGGSHDAELQARIGGIACQTLILQGTLDVRVPASAVRMLKARIPRSQLVYVYDAAHGLELDEPERVGALFEDFLVRGESFIVNQRLPEAAATGKGE